MNYEDIKELAAQRGVSVNDLIALAPANDPFYVGKPGDWVMGRWFQELWHRFGYSTGVHLRRVHYQVISQSPVVMLPNRWGFMVSDAVSTAAAPANGTSLPTEQELLIPAGALRVAESFTWRGPREKDGKPIAGESVRFLPGPALPPEVQPGRTYYVREVRETKLGNQKVKCFFVSARPFEAPLRLTPGSAGVIAEPYENTERCWDYLTQAGKVARYLSLVRMDAFVDRRNPDPRLFAPEWEPQPDVEIYDRRWDTPQLLDMPDLPAYAIGNYHGSQRYHIEIWCEKSTMNDVIIPLCRRYEVNFVTGLGEMSITSTLQVMRRIAQRGRPARILYISDYDPAGQSMPVAVSRKIEHQARTDFGGEDLDIRVYPIVMTAEQVRAYDLPRTPIKETERRAAAFEARHGEGAVELDALEALYPGELATIIETFILKFYDQTLTERVQEEEERLRDDLAELQNNVYEQYQEELDKLRADYSDIERQVAELLEPWVKWQQDLWQHITADLKRQDYQRIFDAHRPPEADEADADYDLDPLYHSERSYNEQLRWYKEHQRKESVEVDD